MNDINNSEGYKKLEKAIKKDCENGEKCFNPLGCDKERHRYMNGHCFINTKCFHAYCDKLKWILERVKHYSEKTGLSTVEILNAWENKRDYCYMNYYQDSRQPLIDSENVKVFDTLDQLKTSLEGKGFRCPVCNHISKNPYECDSKECDWKSYGLLGTCGKGVTIFVKEKLQLNEIFKPIAWEETGLSNQRGNKID